MNYVRVFNELPDAQVVVCDERTDRLDEVARRFPGVELTTDLSEVLEQRNVEAVVVCTPARDPSPRRRSGSGGGKAPVGGEAPDRRRH
jgi:predicted dehydrogenase